MSFRFLALALAFAAFGAAENWPQFRGPATPRPSSGGDRIFLTAFEPETSTLRRLAGTEGRLSVLGLNRTWGGTCG